MKPNIANRNPSTPPPQKKTLSLPRSSSDLQPLGHQVQHVHVLEGAQTLPKACECFCRGFMQNRVLDFF